MLRLAPEAEERASAREERGVRDMEGGGRGSVGERERGWRTGDARGRILSWKMGERDPLSFSLSLSFSFYISLSVFDEDGARSRLE